MKNQVNYLITVLNTCLHRKPSTRIPIPLQVQNWEENDGFLPSFFRQLQVQIVVWFSKTKAYPIGIAGEKAEHSRKKKIDYPITVLRVSLVS